MTTWLFSCSVTAISPAAFTSTNSGSGSSPATAAIPVRSALIAAAQSSAPSRIGTIVTQPAGAWGRAPSFTSSSRSFSIATAMNDPSGARATLSGWPPRSQEAVSTRVATSTVASRPEGAVKLSEAFTPTKAVPSSTVTEVGSPPMSSPPNACGARGSAMSMKPIRPVGLSV